MKNPQFSFTAGELAPGLWARSDLARYATALKTCRNFIVRPQGGVENRSGTRYVDTVINSARPMRLIPFTYSVDVSYVIVFNNDKIRFVRNGATVSYTTTTAYGSGTVYALGALVLSGGITYRSLAGSNVGHTPADSPTWWEANPPYEITSPYGDFELPRLHFTQSGDVLTIAVGSRPVYDLKRYGENDWRLELFDAVDGPFRDVNVNEAIKIAASAATGNITLTANTALFTANMVGSLVYMEPQELRGTKPWEPGERNITVGSLRRSDFKVYKCVSVPSLTGLAGTPYYVSGATRPTHETGRAFDGPQDSRTDGTNGYKVGVEWEYVHGGYGIARITAFSTSTSVSATVIKRLPDECVGGLGSPSTTWTFSGDGTTLQFTITGAVSDSPYSYEVTIGGAVVPNEPAVGGGGGGSGAGGDWPPGAEIP